ncbi:MAG: hypothetical protein KUG49_00760 [Dokdonia sp.]|nr:hypothetical protein [Dokdonia sp.]
MRLIELVTESAFHVNEIIKVIEEIGIDAPRSTHIKNIATKFNMSPADAATHFMDAKRAMLYR